MDTLIELLDTSVKQWANVPALRMQSDEPWSWTYAELQDASRRVATYLHEAGIKQGDRVVIWGASRPEWVAAFFGIQLIGGIVIPLDIRSAEDFFLRIVEQTQPSYIFVGKDQQPAIGRATAPYTRLEELRQLIEGYAPYSEDAHVVGPDDIAELVFTSGTTGNPKGVILTHKNIVSNVKMVQPAILPSPRHRMLSLLPLSHMFEQTAGLFIPLSGGASVTYTDSLRPDVIFRTMAMCHITNMNCVPQVLQLFRGAIEREIRKQGKYERWSQLHRLALRLPFALRRFLFRPIHRRLGGAFEFFAVGGAFLDPELARWWEGLGVKVVQGYGMTEAAPVVTMNSLARRNPASVGSVPHGCEVMIAEDGEILVRGPQITPGYWQNDEATSAVIRDGWYHTGDLGQFDTHGDLYLRGRKKNMIALANGMKVYPEDVEQALMSQSGVKEVVVLGLNTGQDVEVHAILLLDQDGTAPDAIVKGANRLLAPHQQVRGYTLWPDESFPLTPTLKIKRAEVASRIDELRAERSLVRGAS